MDVAREPDLFEDRLPVKRIGYMTDLLTERAIQYVSRRHSRPFYLSLHYTAPHWPWEGPADGYIGDKLEGLEGFRAGGSLKTYAAMMKSLDDGIGQVMIAQERQSGSRNSGHLHQRQWWERFSITGLSRAKRRFARRWDQCLPLSVGRDDPSEAARPTRLRSRWTGPRQSWLQLPPGPIPIIRWMVVTYFRSAKVKVRRTSASFSAMPDRVRFVR
jgi:hypothetical protein